MISKVFLLRRTRWIEIFLLSSNLINTLTCLNSHRFKRGKIGGNESLMRRSICILEADMNSFKFKQRFFAKTTSISRKEGQNCCTKSMANSNQVLPWFNPNSTPAIRLIHPYESHPSDPNQKSLPDPQLHQLQNLSKNNPNLVLRHACRHEGNGYENENSFTAQLIQFFFSPRFFHNNDTTGESTELSGLPTKHN